MKMLLAVDGSQGSMQAVRHVLDLARDLGVPLRLVSNAVLCVTG